MAKFVVLFLFLVLVGFFLVRQFGGQAPLRGMATVQGAPSVLLSRARPPLSFALDPKLRLLNAGWCDVRPETNVNDKGSARLWIATYAHEGGSGAAVTDRAVAAADTASDGYALVVTAVCDGQNDWLWRSGAEDAFRAIRRLDRPFDDKRDLHETLHVLTDDMDPFHEGHGACLVYRARLVLEFDRVEVLAEVHEPLDAKDVHDVAFDTDRLNAFMKRARALVQPVALSPEQTTDLEKTLEKMSTLDKAVSRTRLARWTGDMHRKGQM